VEKIEILVSGKAELKSTIDQLEKMGKVDASNATQFKKNNQEAQKQVKETNKGLGTMSAGLQGIGTAIAGAFTLTALINFGKAVFNVTAEFQKLEAVLTNTLGSKGAALRAMSMIQDFASKTPFSVKELTASFVKLANQGFKPTADEMRKLGDIASSQGKSFDQLTESIIDAQTGEFERLKEFGIRASKEGDKVKFTFKGVKTEVDFTNKSIRDYILSLGDAAGVSGSMEAVSKTLEGQVSNLGDAWDTLLNTIGSGNSGVMSDAISIMSQILTNANDFVKTDEQRKADLQATHTAKLIESQNRAIKVLTEERIKLGEDEATATKKVIEEQIEARKKQSESYDIELEKLKMFVTGDRIILAENIKGRKQANEAIISDLQARIQTEEKDSKAAAEENAKLRDKAFKEASHQIDQLEKLALMAARNAGATEGEIIEVQKRYQVERIKLYQTYLGNEVVDTKIQKEELKKLEKDLVEYKEKIGKDNQKMAKGQADAELDIEKKRIDKIIEEGKRLGKANQEQAQAQADRDKEYAKKKKDANNEALDNAIDLTNTLVDGFFDQEKQKTEIELNSLQERTDKELSDLENRKNSKLVSENAYLAQKKQIEKKALEEEKKLKEKQFNLQKKEDIIKIGISTVVGVAKTMAQFGFPLGTLPAGILAAQGAAQAAFVASRKYPGFKDGVVDFKGKGTTTSDENLVRISKGESVIKADATAKYKNLLERMNNGESIYPITAKESLSEKRAGQTNDILLKALSGDNYDDFHLRKTIKEVSRENTKDLGNKIESLKDFIGRKPDRSKYKF
jgi:hypothetical protein